MALLGGPLAPHEMVEASPCVGDWASRNLFSVADPPDQESRLFRYGIGNADNMFGLSRLEIGFAVNPY